MRMKRIFNIIAICIVSVHATAQIRNPEIDNLRLDFVNGRVLVKYDLDLKDQNSACSIDVLFVDEQYNYIRPKAVKGAVGPGQISGTNKEIYWDFNESTSLLQRRMRPVLVQNQSEYFSHHGAGPNSALFSMIFPGLGDHRVADPQNMIFKPFLRTVSTAVLIGTGISAIDKRIKIDAYRVYEPGFDYKPKFYPAQVKYWLFPYDAEVFIGVGASIWIADILWVYAHGRTNEKMIKSFRENGLTFNISPNSCFLGYNF